MPNNKMQLCMLSFLLFFMAGMVRAEPMDIKGFFEGYNQARASQNDLIVRNYLESHLGEKVEICGTVSRVNADYRDDRADVVLRVARQALPGMANVDYLLNAKNISIDNKVLGAAVAGDGLCATGVALPELKADEAGLLVLSGLNMPKVLSLVPSTLFPEPTIGLPAVIQSNERLRQFYEVDAGGARVWQLKYSESKQELN